VLVVSLLKLTLSRDFDVQIGSSEGVGLAEDLPMLCRRLWIC